MTKVKTVFVLRLGAQNICVRTNLLHTHKHLLRMVSVAISAKFPSYSTFNRRLASVGSVFELQTEMGTFTIEHHPLLIHLVEQNSARDNGNAGMQPKA